MIIFKEFTFEAAHKLPLVPENHKCSNLHGHSFKVKICIDAPINEMGWVMDFSELKQICSPHINELDHSYLNEIAGLENPTSENIAIWLWKRLIKSLENLSSIEVMETCNSGCKYSG
ncbi:6-carboxytetrahydropterin synthase QueD [Gammaproteobacteria bacterium]|nr:6-carboxytetrahydropterin synthase QueD [Gammaproteobacteria bacterium]